MEIKFKLKDLLQMAYTIDGWRTLLSFKQNPKKLRVWELKEHPNKGWGGGGGGGCLQLV